MEIMHKTRARKPSLKIGIIGTGNMGEALLKGMLDTKAIRRSRLLCCDRHPALKLRLEKKYGMRFLKAPEDVAKKSDVLFFCVKPQDAGALLASTAPAIGPKTWVISVMAGITTTTLQRRLKLANRSRIIRTMPNLPCLVQKGVVGLFSHAFLREARRSTSHDRQALELTTKIFQTIGKTVRLKREKDLDLFTAIGGSGPGFIAFFIEAFMDAASKMALSPQQTQEIVIQMISGTCDYLKTTGVNPSELRVRVSSKGGTTLAGLESMSKNRLGSIIRAGILAAARRARALARQG